MLKERILHFIEYKGISKNKFYIETGIANGTLDKKSGLSMETVEKFYSKYEEVNPEWILTGKGEMLRSDVVNEVSKVPSKSNLVDFNNLSIEDKLNTVMKEMKEMESRIFGERKNMKKFNLQDIYLLIEDIETKQDNQYAIFNNILSQTNILEYLDTLGKSETKKKGEKEKSN